MDRLLFFAFILSTLWACGSGENQPPNKGQDTAANQTSAVTPSKYPGYPQEKVKLLFDSSDYVDVIFYYEDFSINQHNQSDIRGMLNYISQNVPQTIDPACQPIGRIFFQIDGRNEAEADIYFQKECLFFLFYENGKKTYANGFTQAGVNFFNNIFAQVNAKKKAMQQQGQ